MNIKHIILKIEIQHLNMDKMKLIEKIIFITANNIIFFFVILKYIINFYY